MGSYQTRKKKKIEKILHEDVKKNGTVGFENIQKPEIRKSFVDFDENGKFKLRNNIEKKPQPKYLKYEVTLKESTTVMTRGGRYHIPSPKTLNLKSGEHLVLVTKKPSPVVIIKKIGGWGTPPKYDVDFENLIPLGEGAKKIAERVK